MVAWRRCCPHWWRAMVFTSPPDPAGRSKLRADAGGAQVPHAADAGAGALERGQDRLPVADRAQVPAAQLHRGPAVRARRVAAHSGGIDRPRAARGSALAGTGVPPVRVTGVVSISNGSAGVHSKAVPARRASPASPARAAWSAARIPKRTTGAARRGREPPHWAPVNLPLRRSHPQPADVCTAASLSPAKAPDTARRWRPR